VKITHDVSSNFNHSLNVHLNRFVSILLDLFSRHSNRDTARKVGEIRPIALLPLLDDDKKALHVFSLSII